MSMEKIKVGDEVVVTMLPGKDIHGNNYDEVGGGGVVLEVKENSTVVRLFDGPVVEADGTDFDAYRR